MFCCPCRLQDRQKRAELDSLLQGVQLPQQISVAKESLLEARDLPPSQPVQHRHTLLEFQEPEDHEGEARIRQWHSSRTPVPCAIPPTGEGDADIVKHNAASLKTAVWSWSSTYQPSPTHYQSWTPLPPPHSLTLKAGPLTMAHSHVLSSTHPPPSVSTQGWSSNQGWSATHPPPSASSQLPCQHCMSH